MLVLVCDTCVVIRGQVDESSARELLPRGHTGTAGHTAGSDAVGRTPTLAEGAATVAETAATSTMAAARQGRGAEVTGGGEGRRGDDPVAAETVCGTRSELKKEAPHLICTSCSRRA